MQETDSLIGCQVLPALKDKTDIPLMKELLHRRSPHGGQGPGRHSAKTAMRSLALFRSVSKSRKLQLSCAAARSDTYREVGEPQDLREVDGQILHLSGAPPASASYVCSAKFGESSPDFTLISGSVGQSDPFGLERGLGVSIN